MFLTYPDHQGIDSLQKRVCAGEPEYDFTADDGIRHTLWVVSEQDDIQSISSLFAAEVPTLYVADGHHRSASGAIIASRRKAANPGHTGREEYNFFLSVIFPETQMMILPYNRVVKDLKGRTAEELIGECRERFSVERTGTREPSSSQEFSMYIAGNWYTLTPKEGTFPVEDPVKSLDASILQENLLHPVFGVKDPRTDSHIDFVGGIRARRSLRGSWTRESTQRRSPCTPHRWSSLCPLRTAVM